MLIEGLWIAAICIFYLALALAGGGVSITAINLKIQRKENRLPSRFLNY